MKKLSKKWKVIIIILAVIVVGAEIIGYTIKKSIDDYYFNPDGTVRTDANNQREYLNK